MLTKCKFTSEYDKFPYLRCKEEAIFHGLCLFHDATYFRYSKDNEEKVRTRLIEKIRHCISNNQPLSCIGYHIPSIEIKGPASFPAPVYFCNAVFHGKTTFSNLSFRSSDFTNAVFNGVTFNTVVFRESASFSETTFLDKTSFQTSVFKCSASFNGARFKDVKYMNTNFEKQALFQSSIFERAHFKEARFRGKSDFSYTNFRVVRFHSGTEFHLVADFRECVFQDKVSFRDVDFSGMILFFYTLFEDQEKTIFDLDKFTNVSFIDTDITRVKFGENAVWGTQYGDFKALDERLLQKSVFPLFSWNKVPGSSKEEYKLKDHLSRNYGLEWIEKHSNITKSSDGKTINILSHDDNHNLTLKLKGNGRLVTLEVDDQLFGLFLVKHLKNMEVYAAGMKLSRVLATYRNLRENYEYRMRYDEAGKFFIREMELKRNYREVSSVPYVKYKAFDVVNKLLRKEKNSDSDLIRSKVISNGWLRRNLSLIGLYHFFFMYGESLRRPFVFLLLPLFISSTLYFLTTNAPQSYGYKSLLYSSVLRSALDMIQVQYDNAELVDNLIRVVSLAMLGTFFIPLRRRFERRFRH